MSTTNCATCGQPSSFMSRLKGKLLCPQCLFGQTIQSSEKSSREENIEVKRTEVQLQGEIEESKLQVEVVIASQASTEHRQEAIASDSTVPIERRLLVGKISELRHSLYRQKSAFDQQLQRSLVLQTKLIDKVYQGMQESANSTFTKLQETLDLALAEIAEWQENHAALSSSTRLLVDHFDEPIEKFTFFNFDTDYQQCVHLDVTELPQISNPWEEVIGTFGSLCDCERCEKIRDSLGVPPVRPWICLNCGTVRDRESYCDKCGCGRSHLDFLAYHEVKVIENGTKWVCKSCKATNSCTVLKCEKCRRGAERPAGIPWLALFSSMFNT